MAITTVQLTQSLEKSGLLTADRIKDCCETAALQLDNTMPEAVAKQLVRSGHLTRFQAQLALSGKASSLVIGSYVVLEKIGQGGMGQVYKARHKTMKREVALKVISPAVVKDETSRRRFQREVEAAAQLNHQNIVTAYDAGEFKGTHYLVMEYIKGTDLSSLVKTEGPISLESAVGYIQQVAQGLAFAHSQGIVHRDIKPANLLLDESGLVKILDMGLARFDDSDTAMKADAGLTGTGMLMGTIDYMSPEQAMDSKNADARSDIYSLGCTLYFLTTGRAMFEADSIVKRLMAHQSAIIPRISHADQELQQILEKMTAKQAEQRYASCEQLIDELQLWLNHNAVAESPQRSAVSQGIGSRMSTPNFRAVSDDVASDSSDATMDTFAFVERNSTAVDTTPSLGTSDETLVPVTSSPQQIPPTHPLLAAATEAPAETPSAAKQLVMPETLALQSAPSIIVDSQSTVSSRSRSRVRLQNRSAHAAGGKGGRRSWKIYGGLAGGAALVLLAVLVFRLKTPTGTIIIEADQPDIAGAVISVDEQQTITLETGNGQEPIEIRADEKEHTLKVTKGGFESFTQKFRVKAGATQTITVRLEPAGPAKTDVMAPAKESAGSGMEPSSASTPLAAVAGPVDYEAERKAAEWVLSVGGHLQTIDEAGVIAALGPGGKLPDGQWQLKLVNILDGKNINSGDLERLASCRNLKILSVREANIGDAGCITIGRMTNLESLDLLGSSKITNAGIKSLVSLKKLRELGLTFIPISDDAIDAIAGMTELRILGLGETQVTDVGFKKLATLVHLEHLAVPPGVTDQGGSILGNFPQLKKLELKGHQITDTSVAQLQKLPKLTGLSLVGATDDNLQKMKSLTQLRELGLNIGQLTDQGFETLQEFTWLQAVGYWNAPRFDDAVLMRLSENSNLQFVYFDKSSSVSPKGIENFRAARPDVLVADGVQVYPATVPAKAEGDNGDSAKATPPGMEPSSASTPLAPAAGPVDYEAERKAAEWVLSVGGSVQTIDETGVILFVGPGGKLPDGQWQLNTVWLTDCKNIKSGALDTLASCRSLNTLNARGTNIGDNDCEAIGRITNLESLDLTGSSQITNAGIKNLGPLKKLRHLHIQFLPISDEATDVIAGMTELRTLNFCETQVTDVGFPKLATLVHLEDLGTPPGLTDQGLSILGNFPQLKSLGLKQQHVTDISVAQLQKLPKLTTFVLVAGTDENLLRMKGLTQLRELVLNMGQLTDQGFETLQEFKWLQTVRYWNAPGFDDAVLMGLSEITDLQSVSFDKSSSVSPKGIENFRAARPDVLVNDGVQVYPATVPAKAEGDNGDSAKATPHGTEPSSASTPLAPVAGPIDFAAERKAAEWVLSVGGHLQTIDEAGVIAALGPGGKLPDGQWQLKLVNILDGKNINSGDLEKLASCRSLKILGARGQNIGDADCMAIGRMTNLESLDLLGSYKITTAGIKSLVSLKKLRELWLTFIPISDDAIDAIAGMTELRILRLGETQVTEVGFKKLATLIHLEVLDVPPGVTDQGLSILGNFPQLTTLGLKQHQVTDISVAQLQRLPKLINLEVVGATDENIVAMKRLTQLRRLGLNMGLLTEQGFQTLPEFKWLQTFGYANAPGFDDAVLMRLSENSNLQFVFIDKSSSVSPKGIENFRAVRPDVLVSH